MITPLSAASESVTEAWSRWVPIVVACVGLAGVVLTLLQKWRNDRRDAWWKRAQWALDKVMDDGTPESARVIGLVAVRHLQESPLATDTDLRMLDQIADEILRAWRAGP